jgi:orotidine-5'-phosphate decarboxylase
MSPSPVTPDNAAKRIFCALDTPDTATAIAWAEKLVGLVGGVKLGKEFFTANGPSGVMAVALTELPIFLDLKFHDIPNTIAAAVRATGVLRPAMLTIHAVGGTTMIRAAAEAAEEIAETFHFPKPLILAVTVLTSLGDEDMPALGVSGGAADQVMRLAELARDSGADGVICAPHEAAAIRRTLGPGFILVTPGLRPAGAGSGDQKRVMTPAQALEAGADYLVIGRPITGSKDPAAVVRNIAADLAGGGVGETSESP